MSQIQQKCSQFYDFTLNFGNISVLMAVESFSFFFFLAINQFKHGEKKTVRNITSF